MSLQSDPQDFLKGSSGPDQAGELDPSWFVVPPHLAATFPTPLAYVLDALARWLADGTARVDGSMGPAIPEANQPAAVAQWTYYRAWNELVDVRVASPSVASLPGLSRTFSSEQLKTWKEKRDAALAAYEALVQPQFQTAGGFGTLQATRTDTSAEYTSDRYLDRDQLFTRY